MVRKEAIAIGLAGGAAVGAIVWALSQKPPEEEIRARIESIQVS